LSLTSNFTKMLGLSAGLLICSAALAETIVVKSTGPSARAYPPGKAIADNSKLALKAGDSVTILDGRGTRILKGPGLFATTASTATGSSFSALLRDTGTRQVRTGAVRGFGSQASIRPPNVWLIDSTKSGTACVAGTEAPSLWMPSRDAATTLLITRVADNRAVSLAFRPLQSVKSWPMAELPMRNGDAFRISGAGLVAPVALRIATLGPNPKGLESTASALITAGCSAQLDLLIETVSVPSGEETSGG
jgi:hypothetical protein